MENKKGKKSLIFLIFFVVILLISGCNKEKTSDSQQESEQQEPEEKLTMYLPGWSSVATVVNYYNASVSAEQQIELKIFEDVEVMYQQLSTELMAGQGPDLLYFNESSEMNIMTYIRQGVFTELDTLLDQSINWKEYNEMVMNTGIVDGTRYIVPLSYDIGIYLTAEEVWNDYDRDFNIIMDLEHYTEVSKESEIRRIDSAIFKAVNSYYSFTDDVNSASYFGEDTFQSFMHTMEELLTGTSSVDRATYSNGVWEQVADKTLMSAILYGNTKTLAFINDISNGFAYNYNTTPHLFAFSDYGTETDITGWVTEMIGINANSLHKERAASFVEFLLSDSFQSYSSLDNILLSGIPVKTEDFKAEMVSRIDLDEEDSVLLTEYLEILNNVTDIIIRDTYYMRNLFEPLIYEYYAGDISLDELQTELEGRTQLYLIE